MGYPGRYRPGYPVVRIRRRPQIKAHLFALSAAFILGVAPVATAQQAGKWTPGATVRIATEGAYKPWNFRQPGGAIDGFDIELAKLLCADIGFKCVIEAERWASMLPRLDQGKFDIVFAGMSITEPRKSKATFTRAYATTPAVFVAAPGGRQPDTSAPAITLPTLNRLEEGALVAIRKSLLNGVVGVQRGTTHEIFLRDYIEGYARIRTYESQSEMDRDAARGRLAAMLVSLSYAVPLLRGTETPGLKTIGPRLSGGPFGEGVGAAVRRSETQLASAFSNAIEKRLLDGTIRALSVKWFGYDLSAHP